MEKEKPIQARRRRVSASPSKLLSVAVEPSKRRRRSFEASPSNRRSVAVKASKRRRRSVSASPSTRLSVAVDASQRRRRSSSASLSKLAVEASPCSQSTATATLWTVSKSTATLRLVLTGDALNRCRWTVANKPRTVTDSRRFPFVADSLIWTIRDDLESVRFLIFDFFFFHSLQLMFVENVFFFYFCWEWNVKMSSWNKGGEDFINC